jgi:hypothetical protein
MRLVARWISIALHPLFMPLYTLLLAFALDFHLPFFMAPRLLVLPWFGEVIVRDQHLLFGLVFVMTVLFPLTSAVFLQRGGLVNDLMMTTRRERIPTYLLSLFYYGMTYWLLRRTDQHESVFAMFTGAMLVLVLVTAITFRWRISIHMAGIGGLVGALTGLFALHGSFSISVIAAVIIVAGLLGSARMADSDHTPAQLGAGAGLGFGIVFLCVFGSLHV